MPLCQRENEDGVCVCGVCVGRERPTDLLWCGSGSSTLCSRVIVRGEKEERKKDSHPPSWLYNSTLSLSLRLLLLLLYTRNFHLGFFFFFSLSPFSPVCIHCAPRHFLTGPFSTWTDVAPLSNAQSPSSFRAGRVFSRPLFVFFFRLSSFY